MKSKEEYTEEEQALLVRINDEAHALQTGIKVMLESTDRNSGSPKHLRVGINLTMCDHAALVECLIDAGVVRRLDYLRAVARKREQERLWYEKKLNKYFGREITLE